MSIPKKLKEKLKYVPKQYHKWYDPVKCRAKLEVEGYYIGEVKDQTDEFIVAALEDDGANILYVRNQTPEYCLLAVQRSGEALCYCHYKTLEICETALYQAKDGALLQYMPIQTFELCRIALINDARAWEYIDINQLSEQELMMLSLIGTGV